MTTSNPGIDPKAYGLPDERELSALLAGYFPEFSAPAVSDIAGASGHPGFAQPAAYAPTVAPVGAPSLPAVPLSGLETVLQPATTLGTKGASDYVGDISLTTIRADFPILSERVNGHDLVWFDNGATTQKPARVIDRLTRYYEHENSNIHRSAHALAARASDAYEQARSTVASFIGAGSPDNIIFVRGATEGINLVASAFRTWLKPGDEIIISHLEHHANIVPWQIVCQETGALLKVIPVNDRGEVLLDSYAQLLGPRTRLVAVTQVSNVLGTIVPVREIVHMAKRYGAFTLVDGAQSVAHLPINVTELDCDYFVLSGHKIYAPTGIGVLYGKKEALETAPPYQTGGNMIADVTFERTLYQPPPARFEAGTPNIADAIGLGAALEYLNALDMRNVSAQETALTHYGTEVLSRVNGLRIIGQAPEKAGVFSFVIDGIANEDIAKALNAAGIAVRVGHHCAQPILRRYGLEQSVRATLGVYNTREELDFLAETLKRIAKKQ